MQMIDSGSRLAGILWHVMHTTTTYNSHDYIFSVTRVKAWTWKRKLSTNKYWYSVVESETM